MDEPGGRRGRAHDAEAARDAILDAAEEVFAEHGFDGARVDAIAERAGYNKSLLFQYFDDKLGLYSAVIRRADDQTRHMQEKALRELSGLELTMDVVQLRELLRQYVLWYFDYLLENPRIMRMFNWEMAEGWQTFSKIMTERDYQDVDDFSPLFARLQAAGLMRSEPLPILQFTAALFTCHTYLAILPLYRAMLRDGVPEAQEQATAAREFVGDFVVRGLLVEPQAQTRRRSPIKRRGAPTTRKKGRTRT